MVFLTNQYKILLQVGDFITAKFTTIYWATVMLSYIITEIGVGAASAAVVLLLVSLIITMTVTVLHKRKIKQQI